MIENYLKMPRNFEKGVMVKIKGFDGYEPVSVIDKVKVKKGTDKEVILTKEERTTIYDATNGVAFLVPATDALYEALRGCRGEEEKLLIDGFSGLYFARVFDKSVINSREAKFNDYIVNKDGFILYKSEQSSTENNKLDILDEFYCYSRYDEEDYLVKHEKDNGFWHSLMTYYGRESNNERITGVFFKVAEYVAKKSVEECGKFLEDREFETAKKVPPKFIMAYPKFIGDVLSNIEKSLCKKIDASKNNATQAAIIVSTGERIGSELKKIFKGKIEEAKSMPQPASYCIDTKSMFKEGTFDASELEALAKGSNEKNNQAPRKK